MAGIENFLPIAEKGNPCEISRVRIFLASQMSSNNASCSESVSRGRLLIETFSVILVGQMSPEVFGRLFCSADP